MLEIPSNQSSLVKQFASKARRFIAVILIIQVLIVVLFPIEHHYMQSVYSEASARLINAQKVANDILLADEQLTLSANLAVETGDPKWISRYQQNLPLIQVAIAKAEELAPIEVANKFRLETGIANDHLIRLEKLAFSKLADGNTEAAIKIINGADYEYQKQLLSDGTTRFLVTTVDSLSDEVKSIGDRAQLLEWLVALFCFGLSFLVWRHISNSIIDSEKKLSAAQRKIHETAMHDSLTSLPNRAALKEVVSRALSRAKRNDTKVALMVIDLDHFKLINDRFGHLVGDEVLKVVSDRLTDCMRNEEVIARFGGDEFVAVLEYEKDDNSIQQVTERMIKSLSNPLSVVNRELHLGISIGFAIYPDNATSYLELVRKADVALYQTKLNGRGAVTSFNSEMDEIAENKLRIEQGLRDALLKGQIEPYYQPLIDINTGKLCSLEILARWIHPEHGMIAPDKFIPIAESSGLIQGITEALLGRACREILACDCSIPISINLSPEQFLDNAIPDLILYILASNRFPASRLEIELTENALVADIDAANKIITRYKQLGIRVALDDFGTGYSSLGYLSELKVDKIKIDRSFISTMHDSIKSHTIINAIVSLGHSLDLPVVAEGIETEEDLNVLKEMGCNIAQGYLFSKPVPVSDVVKLIHSYNEHINVLPIALSN